MGFAVEVAWALPHEQAVVSVTVEAGATLRQAIERSGLAARFPEIDLERCRVGVFGQIRALDAPVRPGDRVEIYRPLPLDPREQRRRRARR